MTLSPQSQSPSLVSSIHLDLSVFSFFFLPLHSVDMVDHFPYRFSLFRIHLFLFPSVFCFAFTTPSTHRAYL